MTSDRGVNLPYPTVKTPSPTHGDGDDQKLRRGRSGTSRTEEPVIPASPARQ